MVFVVTPQRHIVAVVHVFCIVQSRNTNGSEKCQASSAREEKQKQSMLYPKNIVMGIKRKKTKKVYFLKNLRYLDRAK